jgi:AcrR family transcriptional regulator
MEEKSSSIEERIVLATIECIERHGMAGATNREIAKIAGVNSAAINYYFRSKDALIHRCLAITLKNAFDLREMPAMPGLDAQERCIAILLDLIQGGLNYPGLTRAHFYGLLVAGQDDVLLEAALNGFIDDLAGDLAGRGAALPPAELRAALVQIVSAALLGILAPALFARQEGTDLRDAAAREAYVRRLVARLLV